LFTARQVCNIHQMVDDMMLLYQDYGGEKLKNIALGKPGFSRISVEELENVRENDMNALDGMQVGAALTFVLGYYGYNCLEGLGNPAMVLSKPALQMYDSDCEAKKKNPVAAAAAAAAAADDEDDDADDDEEDGWRPRLSVIVGYLCDMFSAVDKTFPSSDKLVVGHRDTRLWTTIRNDASEDKEEVAARTGRTRWMTTWEAHREEWEKDNIEARMIMFGTAFLEVYVSWLCMRAGADRGGRDPVYVQNSGGRFLYTVEGCEQQLLHSDLPCAPPNGCDRAHFARYDDEHTTSCYTSDRSHGMSVFVTGPDPSLLWVARMSHILAPYSTSFQSSQSYDYVPCYIPPWSVFLLDPRLIHAGSGGKDLRLSVRSPGNLRFFVQLLPKHLRGRNSVTTYSTASNATLDSEYEGNNYKKYMAEVKADLGHFDSVRRYGGPGDVGDSDAEGGELESGPVLRRGSRARKRPLTSVPAGTAESASTSRVKKKSRMG